MSILRNELACVPKGGLEETIMTCSSTSASAAARETGRGANWTFGPPNPFSDEEAAWWKRHEPTIDRWLTSMEEADDPWSRAAEHAASCLVANREDTYSWDGFSVSSFLFEDLWEGGTVGFFGSADRFFDDLVEALRHFVADAVIDASLGERWIEEMLAAREDFVHCYDEATPQAEAIAIVQRRLWTRPTDHDHKGSQLRGAPVA